MSADNLHQDLSFVRSALESSQQPGSPASIYLLWAAISAVGFPLNDVAPGRAPWFWLIASPLGLAGCALVSGRGRAAVA